MPNAARSLHFVLTTLKRAGRASAQDALRFIGASYTSGYPDKILRNTEYVTGTRELIDELERAGQKVDVFRRVFPAWVCAVLAYPVGWTDEGFTDSLIKQEHLDVLESLADSIDANLGITNKSTLAAVRDLVVEAEELLLEDDSISDQFRAYLVALLEQVRKVAFDDNLISSVDLRANLERLWVAFYGAEAQSTRVGKWKGMAEKILYPTISGVLVAMPGVTIQAIQLTQGGR